MLLLAQYVVFTIPNQPGAREHWSVTAIVSFLIMSYLKSLVFPAISCNIFSVPSQPGENRGERSGEFKNRSVKTRDAVKSFHLLQNSHKICWGFHQLAIKARRASYISFIKLLSSNLTKKKKINESRMYCFISFVHGTVNSLNSETANHLHVPLVIFVFHSAMKTHLFTNHNPRTIQILRLTHQFINSFNSLFQVFSV